MKKYPCYISMAAVMAVLVLDACGSAAKNSTPTLDSIAQISTSAAQTAFFQKTQLALTVTPTQVVTNTLETTPTPTPGTPTQTIPVPTVANCANSKLVTDVTIPDGKQMAIGQEFIKTWRMENIGTCDWTTSFKLAFSYGEAMGGQTVALANAVPVGQQVDISVKLKVPDKPGKLTGVWVLLDDKGQPFGELIAVRITAISLSPTPTGSLTATPSLTPAPGNTATSTPTETPVVPTETPTETPSS